MGENIEYEWVEKNLPEKPCKILNFGSVGDKTVGLFIKKGYEIVGIDLLDDPREMDKYSFYKGDILQMDIPGTFDFIYSISTVEHVGLPKFNNGILDANGDIRAVKKLYNTLNPNGILLMTFPYGGKDVYPKLCPYPADWRIYNKETLSRLIDAYRHSTLFFISIGEYIRAAWYSTHKKEPPSMVYDSIHQTKSITGADIELVQSVACVKIFRNTVHKNNLNSIVAIH